MSAKLWVGWTVAGWAPAVRRMTRRALFHCTTGLAVCRPSSRVAAFDASNVSIVKIFDIATSPFLAGCESRPTGSMRTRLRVSTPHDVSWIASPRPKPRQLAPSRLPMTARGGRLDAYQHHHLGVGFLGF